jgi:hypothetical protein
MKIATKFVSPLHELRIRKLILTVPIAFLSLVVSAQQNGVNSIAYKGTGNLTQGRAEIVNFGLFTCQRGRSRVSAVGEIEDSNGRKWTVPASQQFASGSKATNLYNECVGITPDSLAQVDINRVPVVEVDADGEVITGYIFADNYFELFINGKLIGIDPIPFTPFNSNIVRFKVKKPYEIAVKLIDWEENLGLGSENNRGKKFHPGDGGFIASFSDGTVTDNQWSAQTFYISPIYDLSCLTEENNIRGSAACTIEGSDDGENGYGIHWSVPDDWVSQGYDYSDWPKATTYTEEEIGVNNKKSYMNFKEKFAGVGAKFIWSSNVVLDNEVLLRYRVKY